MAKKQKKLSLSQIKKDDKQYEEMSKIEFENDTYLHIKKKFRPSLIDETLLSFAESVQQAEKIGIRYNDKTLIDFLILHIIKNFSTLGSEIPDEIGAKVKAFHYLIDNEYVHKLVKEFDQDEIAKVFSRMYEKLDEVIKLSKHNQDLKRQLMDKIDEMGVQNKEIIKDVFFGEELSDEYEVEFIENENNEEDDIDAVQKP